MSCVLCVLCVVLCCVVCNYVMYMSCVCHVYVMCMSCVCHVYVVHLRYVTSRCISGSALASNRILTTLCSPVLHAINRAVSPV